MKKPAGSSWGVPIGATLLVCSAVDPLHALRDEMQRVAPSATHSEEASGNKKALVSEGFSDKQVLDLVGCAGKI